MRQVTIDKPYFETDAAALAFSKQSIDFDRLDKSNPILNLMREQVYRHTECFMSDSENILELGGGTGIDAQHFAERGHSIHSVDISKGMIRQMEHKIDVAGLKNVWSLQQLSFTELDKVKKGNFKYVFSNMGALNCTKDLSVVFKDLPLLLSQDAHVTLVVMTHLAPWEWLAVFKFHFRHAFRRVGSKSVSANILGQIFPTYYHSLRSVKRSLGDDFTLLKTESLGLFIPPPDKTYLLNNFAWLFKLLIFLDKRFRGIFPFNRIGDHVIMTFQYHSRNG